jgi:hypothetical protein
MANLSAHSMKARDLIGKSIKRHWLIYASEQTIDLILRTVTKELPDNLGCFEARELFKKLRPFNPEHLQTVCDAAQDYGSEVFRFGTAKEKKDYVESLKEALEHFNTI